MKDIAFAIVGLLMWAITVQGFTSTPSPSDHSLTISSQCDSSITALPHCDVLRP